MFHFVGGKLCKVGEKFDTFFQHFNLHSKKKSLQLCFKSMVAKVYFVRFNRSSV